MLEKPDAVDEIVVEDAWVNISVGGPSLRADVVLFRNEFKASLEELDSPGFIGSF